MTWAAAQERGEPGDGVHAAVAGGRRQPARQPPPGPPLGQVLQPRLADRGELQGDDVGGVDAQAAQLPGVAGVLVVPALSLRQRGDLAAGVDQQRGRLPGLGGIGPAGLPPGLLAAVEQRDGSAGGQPPDQGPDRGRLGLQRGLVPPALQGVLHLQPQLRGQRGQVRALAVGVGGPLVAGEEPGQGQGGRVLSTAGGGSSTAPRAGAPTSGQKPIRHAACPGCGATGGTDASQSIDVRLAGPDPGAQVPLAQPAPQRPEAAAGEPGSRPAARARATARQWRRTRPGSGRPALTHRWWCALHRPAVRAVRPHCRTRQAGPPNTGSPGSNTSTLARNSGRTAAIRLASSPGRLSPVPCPAGITRTLPCPSASRPSPAPPGRPAPSGARKPTA